MDGRAGERADRQSLQHTHHTAHTPHSTHTIRIRKIVARQSRKNDFYVRTLISFGFVRPLWLSLWDDFILFNRNKLKRCQHQFESVCQCDGQFDGQSITNSRRLIFEWSENRNTISFRIHSLFTYFVIRNSLKLWKSISRTRTKGSEKINKK